MNKLQILFEDSKKVANLNKRTWKSYIRNIDNLEYDKQIMLIIFFTELEPKSKEYKKFWRIFSKKYTVDDVFEADCFLNLYKICPQKEVITILSRSKHGLEIIARIFDDYSLMKEDEKMDLLRNCLVNGVKNSTLEKELRKICYNGEILDSVDVLIKAEYVDEDIFQSFTSTIILECLNKTSNNYEMKKEFVLVRNLLYKLFEECNYVYIEEFRKENRKMLNTIFGSTETTLKGLACKAYLFGNNETDQHVLRILANDFDKSIEDVIRDKLVLRSFQYPTFNSDNVRKYIKDNLWLSSFVSKLFCIFKEFLPDNTISLLIQEDFRDYTDYYRVIDTVGYKNKANLKYKEAFFSVAMKSSKFKNYMINDNGFTYLEDEDMIRFISKWTKREDFEFYLSYLVNNNKLSKYEEYLRDFNTNTIVKEKSTMHMAIYNHINSLKSMINNGQPISKDFEVHCNGLFKSLESLDIDSCYVNIIGIALLCTLIDFLTTICGHVPHFEDKILTFYNTVLDLNQDKKNDEINRELWMSLQNIPDVFVDKMDSFYKVEDDVLAYIIKNRKLNIGLENYEKYECSSLSKIVIKYITEHYTIQEVLDTIITKYEDERDFYYEILLSKSKNQEYDARIFELNDSPWLDRIYNEIFVIEEDEIFEMLRISKPEFLFDYSIRHKSIRKKYFELIDKKTCSISTAIEIYEIVEMDSINNVDSTNHTDRNNHIDVIYGDKDAGNLEYQCAVSFFYDLDSLCDDKLRLIYLLSYIRPVDSKFILFKYFEIITSEVINMKKHRTKDEEEVKEIIDFIFSVQLTDKFFVFAVMDDLVECMRKATQTGKYLVLKNFESKSVTKVHIYEYLDIVTSLLHDTNVNIFTEAKRLLNNVSFMSPEMLSLRSQLIQCLIDKIYVKPFYETLFVQVFNHYICVNSLTLLVQILRTYIKDYKEDTLFIIEHLPAIVKPSDFSFIMPSLFNILSKFVIDNQFYTDEIVKTTTVLLEHSKNIDFTLLVDNIDKSLSVGALLVKTLKMCDTDTQRNVTSRVISENNDMINIPNNFLAYAPELTVFEEYLTHFIPILKEMYESEDYDKRKIAFNAFERISMNDYLIQTALVGIWAIRLNTLDLLMKKNTFGDKELACIFILRHDPHSVVRKKAYELWKLNVDNPNKKLRDIHPILFEYIRYINNSTSLRDSIKNTLSEIVTKYVKYIEIYIREYFLEDKLFNFIDKEERMPFNYKFDESLNKMSYIDIIEIVLLECAYSNKLLDLVYMFSEQFVSVLIHKTLLLNSEYKEKIMNLIKKNLHDVRLKELFEDSCLSQELYNMTGDRSLLANMKNDDKFRLLKNNIGNYELVKDILQSSQSSLDIEEFVSSKDVEIQFLYLLNIKNLNNFGNLQKIFNTVFMKKKDNDLQSLIIKSNTKYILETTYKNIENYDRIINIVVYTNTLEAIGRLEEIIDYLEDSYFVKYSINMSKSNLQVILGFLFYNFLFYENRNDVKNCMIKLIKRTNLSEYDEIIKRTILKQ